VPPLLPYLANRGEQERSLEAVLKRVDPRNMQPMVCVIHGDEDECHEAFLGRIKDHILPKLATVQSHRTSLKSAFVKWPERCRGLDELHEELRRSVAEKIRNDPAATLAETNATLVHYPGLILFHTTLLTQEYQEFDGDAVKAYLQFWQQWPTLAPGQFILVCLCVKYQVKEGLGLHKRLLYHYYVNQRLVRSIERLAQESLDRVIHTVLPRLEEVRQQDVENWVEAHARHFCQDYTIFGDVRSIFREWEKKNARSEMPMEVLATELTKVLQKQLSR
jgi:hypothetical protein